MTMLIAVLSVIIMAACVPLVILKPKWVFYIFLTYATFGSIFTGYIYASNNLGLPRTWTPTDALSWLTLLAALFVPRERQYGAGLLGKCMIIMAVISGIALIQGLVLHFNSALTYSRVVHFVAAMIFALRYFTNYSRVNGFLKFAAVLLLVMFAFHVLIRFGIYTPPSAELEFQTQLGGERGTRSLVPLLYLALISIAIGRLVSKVGSTLMSALMLLVGVAGIMLSETRSMYGAMGVIIVAAAIFIKGRVKTLVLYGLISF